MNSMIRAADSLFPFYTAERWVEETPIGIQDALQDQLRAYLGRGFTCVLLGSGGQSGSCHYSLQIYHDKSGQHLELHGAFDRHCVQDIFKVAQQMKMRFQPAQGVSDKVRLLEVPRFIAKTEGTSITAPTALKGFSTASPTTIPTRTPCASR
ncbi:hypothetical protein HX882_22140 [Pseudomonas gingeri]|uniref:Uncharacterized protein n=1 Tax=Pseudomonas gingeri TaxID=117681 RepID=A0A7Y7XEZ2_9PSED|nr:hypothetical protein [Pseudomonas gingeri]NWB98602.1 hypothetical protein [Pseudomonas gingeri]